MSAFVVIAIAASVLLAWIGLLLHPSRPWDLQPVGEDEEARLPSWPAVVVIVPARNEAGTLLATLPALLGQEYPGRLRVIVVDDRSTDGTADVAALVGRTCGATDRLDILRGCSLPDGWIGKPWAMEQGIRRSGMLDDGSARSDEAFVLLTDADILHGPRSLRRLVAESVTRKLSLSSRMALLHCDTLPERLLIPAFAYFFAVLYPMRRVNDPDDPLAAAAGGCMLVSGEALRGLGGLACIRDRVIDDVNLARAVKSSGRRIRLARSRGDVTSLRRYDTVGAIWAMVRRCAFTELEHSWLRLGACLVVVALLFGAPPALLVASASRMPGAPWAIAAILSGLAWLVASATCLPAIRAFRLAPAWALTLPLAGLLYGGMTLDSALRYAAGRPEPWRSS